jgi:hypothetical protein
MANSRTKRTSKHRTRKNVSLKRRQKIHRRRRTQRGGDIYMEQHFELFKLLNPDLAKKMLEEYNNRIVVQKKCNTKPTGSSAVAFTNAPLDTRIVSSDALIIYSNCVRKTFYDILEENIVDVKRMLTDESTGKFKTYTTEGDIGITMVKPDYEKLITTINDIDKKLNPPPSNMAKISKYFGITNP